MILLTKKNIHEYLLAFQLYYQIHVRLGQFVVSLCPVTGFHAFPLLMRCELCRKHILHQTIFFIDIYIHICILKIMEMFTESKIRTHS